MFLLHLGLKIDDLVRTKKISVFLCIALCALYHDLLAIKIGEDDSYVDIKPAMQIAFVSQNSISSQQFSQKNFLAFTNNNVNFKKGITVLKIPLQNRSKKDLQLFLNVGSVDSTKVYLQESSEGEIIEFNQKSGLLIPVKQKSVPIYRTAIIPIILKKGFNGYVYVSLYQTNNLIAKANALNATLCYHLFTNKGMDLFYYNYLVSHVFVGILFLMLLISLLLLFVERRRDIVFIILLNAVYLTVILLNNGFFLKLGLIPDGAITKTITFVLWNLNILFFFAYCIANLKLRKVAFGAYIISWLFPLTYFIACLIYLFGNPFLCIHILVGLFPISTLFLWVVSFLRQPRKNKKFLPVFILSSIYLMLMSFTFLYVYLNNVIFIGAEIITIFGVIVLTGLILLFEFMKIRAIKNKNIQVLQDNLQMEKLLNQKGKDIVEQTVEYEEKLNKMVRLLKKSASAPIKEEITEKVNTIIEEKDNWLHVKKEITVRNPAFFVEIKEKFPQLSSKDIKLLIYIYKGYSSKEIALVFGVNETSVGTSRNRIRKKLNLEKGSNLNQFLIDNLDL